MVQALSWAAMDWHKQQEHLFANRMPWSQILDSTCDASIKYVLLATVDRDRPNTVTFIKCSTTKLRSPPSSSSSSCTAVSTPSKRQQPSTQQSSRKRSSRTIVTPTTSTKRSSRRSVRASEALKENDAIPTRPCATAVAPAATSASSMLQCTGLDVERWV
jgi:hypothetical protein